jgi:hypothetical protein
MTQIEVRPAKSEDVEAFYGRKSPDTIKAFVGIVDGEVAGFGGIKYARDGLVFFGDLKDVARAHPLALVKGCKAMLATVPDHVPVFCLPDGDVMGSERFLEFLGFAPAFDNVWRRN